MPRFIMHLDMDAFFAAIEQRDKPELLGKPVIIGAMPGARGVVATCSYEARRFGIHSAMPISQAYKRCPQGAYLPPDIAKYCAVSQHVMSILSEISPTVEPVSIDEAFVDITGLERVYGTPEDIGRRTKRRIREETSLSASVGIGPNRLIAKLASDFQKPDGLTLVRPEDVAAWLEPMPVSRLRGVGPHWQKQLARLGIRTVAELRRWDLPSLGNQFGERGAEHLYNQARGIASDRVGGEWDRKSVSKEVTFGEDTSDIAELLAVLLRLSEEVGRVCRKEQRKGLVVTLKIRLAGFETHTRRRRLDHTTCSDRRIYAAAKQLLLGSGFTGRLVRLIGVGMSVWESERGGQLDMSFVDEHDDERLLAAVDELNRRFGRGAVSWAGGKAGRGQDNESSDD
ncbi:MAG: DNA polymerase IV [Candidatus Lernaella stagnicola]|nr:DNA polymerase IV [Candidatus Lernaella stagnicola]